MEIRIDPHTLARAAERGVTPDEIRAVIESGVDEEARGRRLAKAAVFEFARERAGRLYPQKRVRVVTTVTVYAYCGSWE